MSCMKNGSLFVFRAACLCLLNALFLVAVATGTTLDKKGSLKITRVGLDTKVFNPSKGETVTLGFEVTRQAGVQVAIYDTLGQKVQSFDMPDLKAGRHNITWDGRRVNGKLAAGDVFLYVIEAKTKDGNKVIYNPARKTGGFEVKPLEYTLDKKTGEIEYVLPKACMIRIRAGLKDGMFTGSVFEWEPRTAGRHNYKWDGKDNSDQMNLLRHRDLDIRLTCYTLPANTIITTGTIIPFAFEKNPGGTESRERSRLWATEGKYFHYQHAPRSCHQPNFKVLFPTQAKSNSVDAPVVSGIVPVRIELDQRDAQHLINTRFEIMLFVDGVFIYEIEEGSSPFTFNWDTKGFAKSPHIVTVNLIAYDDHIGIVSRKVILGD